MKADSKTTDKQLTEKSSSFAPISNKETEVLILGTLPGKRSLELEEICKKWEQILNN